MHFDDLDNKIESPQDIENQYINFDYSDNDKSNNSSKQEFNEQV